MNQHLKYVPTFRLRQEEYLASYTCRQWLGGKIIPLFEVVTETPPHRNGNFADSYRRLFQEKIPHKFFLDLPSHIDPGNNSVKPEVRRFLQNIRRSRNEVISRFVSLRGTPHLVPVLSYNPTTYTSGTASTEAQTLRSHGYTELGYRIQANQNHWAQLILDIQGVARPGEVVILDCGDSLPTNSSTALSSIKTQINTIAGCKKIFLRSAIPSTLSNVGLTHGASITSIDNSHITQYALNGYDAFGDYVSVKKELPKTGGTISPGLIYYTWSNNEHFGFKGHVGQMSEFTRTIVPALQRSPAWLTLSATHRQNCPGCIAANNALTSSPGNQGLWKRITMMHYLYSMHEHL